MLAEFSLATCLQVGLDECPTFTVSDSLPVTRHGENVCHVDRTYGPQCKVTLNRSWLDSRDRWVIGARYTKVENTVLHELCHVKVYKAIVEKMRTPGRPDYHFSDRSFRRVIQVADGHSRTWERCMRSHSGFFISSR